MTDAEKIAMVKALGDDRITDALALVYLCDAGDAILRRRYPFVRPENPEIGDYDMLQVKLAARYSLRKGGGGETHHDENGIKRTYGSVNDADLLQEVVPIAQVIA